MKLVNLKIMLLIAVIAQTQTQAVEVDSLVYKKTSIEKNIFLKEENVHFYLFASLGLSDNLLKQMFEYARLYKGTIVLRGIKDNCFIKTSDHIQRVAQEGEAAAIIIDPTLFKEFQITKVPSYVLTKSQKCPVGVSCKKKYDKIIGNITPKYALEKFSEKGDLFNEARIMLGRPYEK